MKILILAIPLIFGIPLSTQASIVTFDELSTFITTTTATATAPLANTGLLAGSASNSQTVGNLTFSITAPSFGLFFGTFGTSIAPDPWTTRLNGNQIAISDVSNLNVDLSNPVFSFGFEFVEPEFDPNVNQIFVDSSFEVSLLDNGVIVDSFTFNAINDAAAFVGVWGDTSFNRVEIREIVGGPENEFFGQFYTGTSPVPVPAAVWLFATALIGLLGIGRSRSSASSFS